MSKLKGPRCRMVALLVLFSSCSSGQWAMAEEPARAEVRAAALRCIGHHIEAGNPLWDPRTRRPARDVIDSITYMDFRRDGFSLIMFHVGNVYPGAPSSHCYLGRKSHEIYQIGYELGEGEEATIPLDGVDTNIQGEAADGDTTEMTYDLNDLLTSQ